MILFASIWTCLDYILYNAYGKYNEMSYRSFQIIITPIFAVIVLNFYSWQQAGGWLILLWFGVYDFGYMVINFFIRLEKEYFFKNFFTYEMNWFGWSPVGWITGNKVKPYQLVISNLIAIGIIILI